MRDRVVITGIGMVTSVGQDRETTWQAVRSGVSGVRQLEGVAGIPSGRVLGATVDLPNPGDGIYDVPLAIQAAAEALDDCQIEHAEIDPSRFGSSIAANMGDTPGVHCLRTGASPAEATSWAEQWLPITVGAAVGKRFNLHGPRLSSTAACASGTIAVLNAARAIQDNQCDMALAGASQPLHPLLAAGFHNMRVLARGDDPVTACRPFDANRTGFVLGEGSAMLVLESLEHALQRGAPIYAEVAGGRMLCDAHHVTDLNVDSTALSRLIQDTLWSSHLAPSDIGYINAHGTGTLQNDVMESRGIRSAFGGSADSLCVSSTKAMLGHLLSAAGSVELAITALALRDGYAPPTINLTDPDPECDLDCVPLVGRQQPLEHALKLSIAFGGHLAAVALRRWNEAGERRSQLPTRLAA
jgi:3-oxoacyl-[acyl-carrier-protein] synthase II